MNNQNRFQTTKITETDYKYYNIISSSDGNSFGVNLICLAFPNFASFSPDSWKHSFVSELVLSKLLSYPLAYNELIHFCEPHN